MKAILLFFLLVSTTTFGQRLRKDDKQIIKNLQTTITYLASDKLEGRRTGTKGAALAYHYLADQFKSIGLTPKGDGDSYLQKFDIDEGKQILPATALSINKHNLVHGKDYILLSASPNGTVKGMASPSIKESGSPWFWNMDELFASAKGNPHFDMDAAIAKRTNKMKSRGATAVIAYSNGNEDSELKFEGKSKDPLFPIPVIYLNSKEAKSFLQDATAFMELTLTVDIGKKERSGHNVIGFLDNGAPYTIVIGAHFDHLGYGQDHNSLWTGKPEIHNGADDNASGTALVLEMAKMLKGSKYNNKNYLFICFSGEELGLFGSKYFTEHPTVPLDKIDYMINCDMVGRLNTTKQTVIIGGYGTSPVWGKILPEKTRSFTVTFDSSGIGPSDHTSFYLKNIPVLFFFTGTHADYHKPTDDVEKINFVGELRIIKYIYDVLKSTDKTDKLVFTKTKEPAMENRPGFSVTLGIMPDYTSNTRGLQIDGVIDGKIASKAGMQTGDVITQIGGIKVNDIQDYMKALSTFKKGDAAKVTILRKDKEKVFDVVF